MTRIVDLLDRDFSRPVEDVVRVNNDDPAVVFSELTEYIATDRIKAAYERLFSAMAAAAKSPNESPGVWISGIFGSGSSSFAKNLGYVVANRVVLGTSASSLFLKQVESRRVTESVEFLNRAVPYEIFTVDVQVEARVQGTAEQMAEVMYQVLLRDLDYAKDHDISELEIELEKEGKLAAFQDLCQAEYKEDWQKVRKGSQKFVRSSALLYRFDPRTYASTDTWLNMISARPSGRLSVRDLVERLFDLCEIRRPGKSFAFIVDELGEHSALGGERLEHLGALAGEFGRESLERVKAGKVPGPAWIVVTAQEKLQDVCNSLGTSHGDLVKLQDSFNLQIDLCPADIREIAARRVLRKKHSQEPVLRKLFRDRGEPLMKNIRLERCSRHTEFDEDQFVRFYPYLPHLIDLSIDIMAGILLHPAAAKRRDGNRSLVKQTFEMLVSGRPRLVYLPVGALVSIDRIYALIEGSIPPEKQKDILNIRRRFDDDEEYPGMAARVGKAICLMEFAETDLPRTTKNIAALLVQRVSEAPPRNPVASILNRMREAQVVRETENGWKLCDLDDLRHAAAAVERLRHAVGIVNPRLPGWRNDLIQRFKKLVARVLTWYTRPLNDFNAAVSQSLEEVVRALDRLSTTMVSPESIPANTTALDRLSMDIVALERRLAQSEKRSDLHGPGNERTTYIIGLFGTGRRYINELMLQNIGERAKYFMDTIRLHPGPTPMIYSGHATMKHVSRAQDLPVVMSRILGAVRAGFAHSIFVYRHPLDSLLTNWVWWRTYIRDNRSISGISQIYRNTDDLCADLEENFPEFEAFAEGDPEFFASMPGPRFLSFCEFVEETELHVQSAGLALRLEDFMIDPRREFFRIVEVMAVDPDLNRLCIAPPQTRPYGYLAVKDKVSEFRKFIDGLDAETKRKIENIGYDPG
jgi:hypothetical protein